MLESFFKIVATADVNRSTDTEYKIYTTAILANLIKMNRHIIFHYLGEVARAIAMNPHDPKVTGF
ncbi:MAG: hypothetical protein CVU11_01155 [Bacteroidetes bacterium HGW-Bacteroidetes-6]|nr:MAG: hypothetical protein CVU11_01155 [Bacteroidetes bacterium HGW-Bacteroidetes-6]